MLVRCVFSEFFPNVNIHRYIPELSDSSRVYSHVPRDNITAKLNIVSHRRVRKGTKSARLFTPGERKALAKSKVKSSL
jgi:hypothetical protein